MQSQSSTEVAADGADDDTLYFFNFSADRPWWRLASVVLSQEWGIIEVSFTLKVARVVSCTILRGIYAGMRVCPTQRVRYISSNWVLKWYMRPLYTIVRIRSRALTHA